MREDMFDEALNKFKKNHGVTDNKEVVIVHHQDWAKWHVFFKGAELIYDYFIPDNTMYVMLKEHYERYQKTNPLKGVAPIDIDNFGKIPENKKGYEFGKKKEEPKTSVKEVEKAIDENEIYSEVMRYYKKQIAYGLDKYPESLNIDTWDLVETLEHEISEIVDQLNYKVMLKLKLERLAKSINGKE